METTASAGRMKQRRQAGLDETSSGNHPNYRLEKRAVLLAQQLPSSKPPPAQPEKKRTEKSLLEMDLLLLSSPP